MAPTADASILQCDSGHQQRRVAIWIVETHPTLFPAGPDALAV